MGNHQWASKALVSLSDKLARVKPGNTFAFFNGNSTVKPSHIDHISTTE
jgi:hypothetical protein